MNRLIYVTADDIKRGVKGNPCFCPIARSLKRNFPKLADANLRVAGIVSFDHNGSRSRVTPTNGMTNWIKAFDEGKSVAPQTFVIDLPTEMVIY